MPAAPSRLTRYTGPSDVVIVSGTIDGLPVASIGDNAFGNNDRLMCVTISGTVTQHWQRCVCLLFQLAGRVLATRII